MIQQGDIIGYKSGNDFKSVVLAEIFNSLIKNSGYQVVHLPNKKANKFADISSLDSESNNILGFLIQGNSSFLGTNLPIKENVIKPLYLFLDEEILLYAKLKGLKFKEIKTKKDNIESFLDEFEKKHPEVKRAVVNSLLDLYKKN